jgi:hypothetical protein
MEPKASEHSPAWQDKDGLDHQEHVRREWNGDEPEGFDTFPFRTGDRVTVKSRDTAWNAEGREYDLTVGWEGTVMEVCWDRTWTTHLVVKFPETGPVVVGWDVLIKIV